MRNDWANVTFDTVLKQSRKKHKPEKVESLFYVGLEHIQKATGSLTNSAGFAQIKTVKNKFSKGQILYGKLRPYLNKVYQAKESGVCSTDILVFDATESLCAQYALLLMLSRKFVNDMSANTNGVNLPRVSTKYINEYSLPLAPLPEQRVIVAKIEALFSDLDQGIADLKTAQAQLKIYRQAVLKKAFEGELTKSEEIIKPVVLGDELKIVSGNTPKGLKEVSGSGEFQFYKVSDMNLEGNEVEMRTSNLKLTIDELEKLKLKIFPQGTVIFPKRGGAILTNKKRILAFPASFDLNVMGVVPNENYLSKYIYYYFLHLDLAEICDGSAVPQINNKHIAPLEFPKCSLAEQHQIVREIETRLSVCDEVEGTIFQSLEKAEALRQSILKKAFEGRLLTEAELAACRAEPDWEPAAALLARIQAQKVGVTHGSPKKGFRL